MSMLLVSSDPVAAKFQDSELGRDYTKLEPEALASLKPKDQDSTLGSYNGSETSINEHDHLYA